MVFVSTIGSLFGVAQVGEKSQKSEAKFSSLSMFLSSASLLKLLSTAKGFELKSICSSLCS
jgi:hypothetical protein